jgi:hypothetical protein
MYIYKVINNTGGCNQARGNSQVAGVSASGSASGKSMLYFLQTKNRSKIILKYDIV